MTSSSFSPQQGFYFLLTFVMMMALCIFVPRALSFLPALIGVSGAVFLFLKTRKLPIIDRKLFAFFAAISALIIASSFWAPDQDYALGKALKSAALLLTSGILLCVVKQMVAATNHKHVLLYALIILCGGTGFLFAIEYTFDSPVARIFSGADISAGITNGFLYNRSMVFLVLLTMPTLLAFYLSDFDRERKKRVLAFVAISVGTALFLTQSQTAQIAALVALAMMLYPMHKKIMRRGLAITLIALVLAAPFVSPPFHKLFAEKHIEYPLHGFMRKASIPHRLEVWNFVSEKIKEKPLIGHGIEATRFLESKEIMPLMNTKTVLHPHNAVLQIWIEFGLVGILLSIGLLIHLFRKIENAPPLQQHYYAALLVTVLSVMSMGYGLWQAWQIGMIFAVIAMSEMATRLFSSRAS